MSKPLGFQGMLESVKMALDNVREHRTGRNLPYTLTEAGVSALSVFYMQAPSFLAWQQEMEKKKGKNNARNLFGIERIPSDEQVKNLLDPVSEQDVGEPFW